eukprot:4435569-Pyramimonas_sp.AAC.1
MARRRHVLADSVVRVDHERVLMTTIITRSAARRRTAEQWTQQLPEYVVAGVMQQLQWNRASSTTFRMVCKHWQQVHDMLLPVLHINNRTTMPIETASWQRFKGVTSLDLSPPQWPYSSKVTVAGLMAVASALTALTSLNLSHNQVTDEG